MIEKTARNRSSTFNFCSHSLSIPLLSILLLSCSSLSEKLPEKSGAVKTIAIKAAIKVAQPALEKIFFTEAPVLPASRSRFLLENKLPGNKPFNPLPYKKSSISFDSNGGVLLLPGDYAIPVMTYCMKARASSPAGHTYNLALLQGKRASIISDINTKGVLQFPYSEVQLLSWNLQAGLSYEEMGNKSQHMIDVLIPERKKELKESFFERLEKEWNRIAEKTDGLIPSLDETSDELLNEMGDIGKSIAEMRDFRRLVKDAGDDYSTLNQLVDRKKKFQKEPNTQWSKISEQVYARFITEGSFQEIGKIEIRVLPFSQKRSPNSTTVSKVAINIHSWIADPGNSLIQPLTFTALITSQGVLLIPEIAEAPLVITAALTTILATEVIDWDAFFRIAKKPLNASNSRVRQLLEEGMTALKEGHDELEKPARDVGVIDRKTKDTSKKEDYDTREYTKAGGKEQLEKDFGKFPGEVEKTQDGTEIKYLPDGKKVVKRIDVEKNKNYDKDPTLEIQPPRGNIKRIRDLRIKVRYPVL